MRIFRIDSAISNKRGDCHGIVEMADPATKRFAHLHIATAADHLIGRCSGASAWVEGKQEGI